MRKWRKEHFALSSERLHPPPPSPGQGRGWTETKELLRPNDFARGEPARRSMAAGEGLLERSRIDELRRAS